MANKKEDLNFRERKIYEQLKALGIPEKWYVFNNIIPGKVCYVYDEKEKIYKVYKDGISYNETTTDEEEALQIVKKMLIEEFQLYYGIWPHQMKNLSNKQKRQMKKIERPYFDIYNNRVPADVCENCRHNCVFDYETPCLGFAQIRTGGIGRIFKKIFIRISDKIETFENKGKNEYYKKKK